MPQRAESIENEAQIRPAACDGESVPGCVKLADFHPSTVAKAGREYFILIPGHLVSQRLI